MSEESSYLLPKSPSPPVFTDFQSFLSNYIFQFTLEDDAVLRAFKRMNILLIVVDFLWIVSYELIMVQMITGGKFTNNVWLLFLPMWIGSVAGIIGCIYFSVRICFRSTLIPHNGRLYMLESGGSKPDDFVEYHSLPLMRQLFCRSIVFTLFLILLFFSQILYYTCSLGNTML